MEERELIERCRHGDQVAWAELYASRGPAVARFLRHMLEPGADLDDLIQQVFVELFATLGRFRGDATLSTWLFGIATRVALHHLRGAKRRRRRIDALAADAQVGPEGAPDAHGRVEARAHLRVVAGALEALAPDLRAVWIMREIEGLSTAEVAQALRTREGTVRSRLFAARRQILDALAGDGRAEQPAGLGARPARSVP
ncbi:MAG: DNA-directed RNA polymerase sigma-70 factor [Myxococcales bacterium]